MGRIADAMAEIMKNLANQAAGLEGKTVEFREASGGAYIGSKEAAVAIFKKFFTGLWGGDGLQAPSKQALGALFFELKATQNLSEANHRGAFLIVQVIASEFDMGDLSADVLAGKSPFKKKVVDMIANAFSK